MVSVVVPARDAAETLADTLDALTVQDFDDPYEVVVVDAGSLDGTAEVVASAGAPVRLVRGPVDGPAATRNRGVSEARSEVLAFTDADCRPEPGWLRAGLAALRGVDLVQGRVASDPRHALGPFDRTVGVGWEMGLYETANLFVRRQAFERAGGFREWLRPTIGAPHMGEDIDFGWTVRRGGGGTAFAADALVHHAVFPRGVLGFVGERRRLRYFPDIAKRVPELRREMFFARAFLSRRTAAFDLAVIGAAVALRRRSAWPLAAALPYAVELSRGAAPWGRLAPKVAVGHLAADAVGAYSLLLGSVRRRSPVL